MASALSDGLNNNITTGTYGRASFGFLGNTRGGYVLSTTDARGWKECAALCDRTELCFSYYFETSVISSDNITYYMTWRPAVVIHGLPSLTICSKQPCTPTFMNRNDIVTAIEALWPNGSDLCHASS